jgi:predicted O-linked N-acetylglucosamine transferase (SPINDLY family)
MFARKPAPVQLTWLGYVGTTGLQAIDYLIADRYHVPEGTESHFREKVLRLPDGYVCYEPPTGAPPVGPLPAQERGAVTLASFSNPAKITPPVIALWSEIMRRLPESRLLLQYAGFGDEANQRRYVERFAAHGVAPARLDLRGRVPHLELLARYDEVDIALDPFPYSGGLTTCEALWMGVPVVTCPGETFASRHSLSHLSNAGLPETIAHDHADYVERVVALAQDLPRLAALRAGLRERVATSPLCDGPRFAANLLALLRDAWRRWCD